MVTVTENATRCAWARKPLDIIYHDNEWGVPVHDDRVRFELLTLEGAQAGLSWSTVLARREGYRAVFCDWDVGAVAHFTEADIDRIATDPRVIRHRGKIASTVRNAQAFLRVQEHFGSFDAYVWAFVDGAPTQNAWLTMKEVPTKTRESDALSTDLMQRGFTFVGSTICYAYMQATGMVNDHLVSCLRRGGPMAPSATESA